MKIGTFLTIVAAGSAPVLGVAGVDWIKRSDVGRVLHGEDLMQVAQEIAGREFSPDVALRAADTTASRTVESSWGSQLRAEPDKEYRRMAISFTNHGRLDVAVHTYHFAAFDDSHRKYKAELGLAPGEMFEANRVAKDQSAAGVAVFKVPTDVKLAKLLWQGELANATLELTTPAPAEGSPG